MAQTIALSEREMEEKKQAFGKTKLKTSSDNSKREIKMTFDNKFYDTTLLKQFDIYKNNTAPTKTVTGAVAKHKVCQHSVVLVFICSPSQNRASELKLMGLRVYKDMTMHLAKAEAGKQYLANRRKTDQLKYVFFVPAQSHL
jgi:hypothetical protein